MTAPLDAAGRIASLTTRAEDAEFAMSRLGKENARLSRELAEARAALEPFARAAIDCGVEDDLRIGVVKPADIIWESAVAVSITFADVDRARTVLSREKEASSNE